MMSGLLNRLRGQVRVRVECAFPERVLNLCGARDLSFWDLEWENAASFTCRMNRRDYAALSRAAETLHCTLTVVGREGAPFFLSRFRSRQALLAGLVGGGLALFLGSFFIWDFQIEGNETVPEEQILRALEDAGVRIGSFGLSLNGEDIRNRVLLDIPELSWIAVNVSGCRARCGSAWSRRRCWTSRPPPTWWPAGRARCWRSGTGTAGPPCSRAPA